MCVHLRVLVSSLILPNFSGSVTRELGGNSNSIPFRRVATLFYQLVRHSVISSWWQFPSDMRDGRRIVVSCMADVAAKLWWHDAKVVLLRDTAIITWLRTSLFHGNQGLHTAEIVLHAEYCRPRSLWLEISINSDVSFLLLYLCTVLVCLWCFLFPEGSEEDNKTYSVLSRIQILHASLDSSVDWSSPN
jgi:hypothetical protein